MGSLLDEGLRFPNTNGQLAAKNGKFVDDLQWADADSVAIIAAGARYNQQLETWADVRPTQSIHAHLTAQRGHNHEKEGCSDR